MYFLTKMIGVSVLMIGKILLGFAGYIGMSSVLKHIQIQRFVTDNDRELAFLKNFMGYVKVYYLGSTQVTVSEANIKEQKLSVLNLFIKDQCTFEELTDNLRAIHDKLSTEDHVKQLLSDLKYGDLGQLIGTCYFFPGVSSKTIVITKEGYINQQLTIM